ncbi:hypothetical protein AEST_02740 [Alishewanella aestuarii B11]|uniref:Uncharacterized protein n=2 Tax=Alishewanella aestuarii TaxID=453835 RepID=J1Q6A9_9ALTE|nr:hypothetical protein AEST_02740 [Alishewanella aestuarii B11]
MEPGRKFVSKLRISDFFEMSNFVVARLYYQNYLNIIVGDDEVFTSIKSNSFIVSEECPAVTDSGWEDNGEATI